MNIVSFGGGVNSTAMLIGMYERGIPVDLITFADVGAEHPRTYQFIEIFDEWLVKHGFPAITVLHYTDKNGDRLSLEMECLKSKTLPAIAYGYKKCSLKHKIAPQEKFCNNYPSCREVWALGEKVVKFIGYDTGEEKRYKKALEYDLTDKKYKCRYPLFEWGWNRDDCITAIERAGLPQPGKSSCFFCPNMKQHEILELREQYPDLFQRALALEANAQSTLKKLKGLGRNWSWKEKYGRSE